MAMITRNSFAQKVIPHCNYVDPSVVEEVYGAILTTLIEELRKNGKVIMPDFGTLKLHDFKGHRIKNIHTGEFTEAATTRVVKWEPCTKLKNFVKEKI